MEADADHKLTASIHDWAAGNEEAAGAFFTAFDRELRAAAQAMINGDRRMRDAIEPGDLINAAFLKLDRGFKQGNVRRQFLDRVHFRKYVIASLRNLLEDMAKEGGDSKPRPSRVMSVSQIADTGARTQTTFETVDFFHTLDTFAEKYPEDAHLLERHYLLEETSDEIADSMGVARATVTRRLKAARQSFAARYEAGGSGR